MVFPQGLPEAGGAGRTEGGTEEIAPADAARAALGSGPAGPYRRKYKCHMHW